MTPLLLALTMSADAKPPKTPETVAVVTLTAEDGSQEFTLTEHQRLARKAFGDGSHLDPVSTAFSPDLMRGEDDLYWLVGYRLSEVNDPGDVLVTGSLLLLVPPGEGPWTVKALWHENRMAVPTSLYTGQGILTPGNAGGADVLSLQLTDAEYGDPLTLTGLLRR